MYKKIFIKKERAANILSGHPWIFSKAIIKKENLNKGELCEVYGNDIFLGIGYYNPLADIAVRIITRKSEKIDKSFFINRLTHLKNIKELYIKNCNAYRVVYGESDNLPGLIVDKYADTLVVQFHTKGMENLKDVIVSALIEVFKPDCIYSKANFHSRDIEGIDQRSALELYGKLKENIDINENGFSFTVNIAAGQKTGFFLDQRENRKSIMNFTENKKVLNCFCYTGGFSVYAAKNAAFVDSIDISKEAVNYVEKNFLLNNYSLEKHKFIKADVFDYLKNLKKNHYDMIILDPPSFAHKKTQIKNAIKAYTTINSKALEKLPDCGILVSSSCTSFIDELTFIKILHQSSVNTGCSLKVLHSAIQPFDHSYNLNYPEGRYLKFFILLKENIITT